MRGGRRPRTTPRPRASRAATSSCCECGATKPMAGPRPPGSSNVRACAMGARPSGRPATVREDIGGGPCRRTQMCGLEDIDLTDLDVFTERVPHEWFDLLRRVAPVWRHPETADEESFWVVTSYDLITRVHRSGMMFSHQTGPGRNGAGGITLTDSCPEMGVGTQMVMTDPPRHTRYRKLVNRGFTPRDDRPSRIDDALAHRHHHRSHRRAGRGRFRRRRRVRAAAHGDRRHRRCADGRPRQVVRVDQPGARQHRPGVRSRGWSRRLRRGSRDGGPVRATRGSWRPHVRRHPEDDLWTQLIGRRRAWRTAPSSS